jgi:DNA-binding response OmpR family regulator
MNNLYNGVQVGKNLLKLIIVSDGIVLNIKDDIKKYLHCSLITMPLNGFSVNSIKEVIPDIAVFITETYTKEIKEFIRDLRDETVNPILLICENVSEKQILDAYSCGIDEVIQEMSSSHLLIAKLKAWSRRTWTISTNALQNIHLENCILDCSERTLTIGQNPPVSLTNLELRLLYLLMSRSPNVINNEEIIGRVWGFSNQVGIGALKNTVYRLRQKIERESHKSCGIINLPGLGYKFKGYVTG